MLADHRLAAPPDQALDHSGGGIAFALAPVDDPAGQHQTVGRGVDEQRARLAEMPSPIAAADSSGDQAVGGGGVGDAQQSLGKAEQQHAFAAGQTKFMQEGIDAAVSRRPSRAASTSLSAMPAISRCSSSLVRVRSISAATSVSSSPSSALFKSARSGKGQPRGHLYPWLSHGHDF